MDEGEDHMDSGILGAALEREHREIDQGIEEFSSAQAEGGHRVESLTRAMQGLRRHIYLEEELLFPSMGSALAIPMGVMLREHGEIWRTLDALESQLSEGDPTDSVLGTCRALMSQLDAHNSKEEPIFYTRADTALTTSTSAQLRSFLDLGRMPDGWVCQEARSHKGR
jgi:regulator of cell morphogenesis and NO signaling